MVPVGGSSLLMAPAILRPAAGIIFTFAGDNRLLGRALNGKYGLSAVKGSTVACVGLAPGPEYTGPVGLRAYA